MKDLNMYLKLFLVDTPSLQFPVLSSFVAFVNSNCKLVCIHSFILLGCKFTAEKNTKKYFCSMIEESFKSCIDKESEICIQQLIKIFLNLNYNKKNDLKKQIKFFEQLHSSLEKAKR